MSYKMKKVLTVIRGAGDLASGVAHRLYKAGFQVIMTDLAQPTVIRRKVAFAEAIYEGTTQVEGITGRLSTFETCQKVLAQGEIPVLVDPLAEIINYLKPQVVIDAILAKKNIGTNINLAPVVIALGPGFTAPEDAHAVIETQRGHFLGKVIYKGSALPNTGVPGEIKGKTEERVLRAPCSGVFASCVEIGDLVKKDQVVGEVAKMPVLSSLDGVVRGLLKSGLEVNQGMKIGDVDPRGEKTHCFTISDKARALGGAVLEAMLNLLNQKELI
jgi:xanthine dehydrogenase accessory factor